MISYEPFFETLRKKGLSQYYMIYKQGFSANTLYRIKKGKPINMKTLDEFCFVLDCKVTDIIKYVKDEPQPTEKQDEEKVADENQCS